MDWFRSWHGAPADPKWKAVARLTGAAQPEVIALVWALLDRASTSQDRGSVAGYDCDVLADTIGSTPERVAAILKALEEKGVLTAGRFVAWEKRQPKSDISTPRTRKHRARNLAGNGDGTVGNGGNGTDTESDSDSEKDSHSDSEQTIAPVAVSPSLAAPSSALSEAGDGLFGPAECDALVVRYDLVDVRAELRRLVRWCRRRGIVLPDQQKAAVISALSRTQEEREASRALLAHKTGPPLPVSPSLAARVKAGRRRR